MNCQRIEVSFIAALVTTVTPRIHVCQRVQRAAAKCCDMFEISMLVRRSVWRSNWALQPLLGAVHSCEQERRSGGWQAAHWLLRAALH